MPVLNKQQIVQLATDLRHEVWASAHREWAKDDKYYNGNIEVPVPDTVPDNFQAVIPSTARSKVNHGVDQLVTSEPSVKYRPISDSPSDVDKAERISAWGAFVLQRLSREALVPPPKAYAKNQLIYGYSTLYGPTWRESIWPLLPSRKTKKAMAARDNKLKSLFPFHAQVLHPTKVLLDPSEGKNPSFGILHTKRWLRSLKQEYGTGENSIDWASLPSGNFETIECYTYWSEDQYTMLAGSNGEVVIRDGENPYGFLPFLQSFAAFGHDTAYDEPGQAVDHMAVGLLRHIRSSLDSEALIATSLDKMIYDWAFQRVMTTEDAQALADALSKPVAGGLPGKDAVWWQEVPNVPSWVLSVLLDRRRDAEAGTYGEVLRGQRIQGVSTASQHAQIVAKAKQLFTTPMMQVNHVFSLMLGNAARLVAVYQDPVTVQGFLDGALREVTIQADDFQGNFNFDVDYEASDPMERAADLETGMALRNMMGPDGTPGGYPWEQVMKKYVHEQDVAGLRDALGDEKAVALMMQMPEIVRMQMMEIQRKWTEKTGMQGLVGPTGEPLTTIAPAPGGRGL